MRSSEWILGFRPPRIAMMLAVLALAAHWALPNSAYLGAPTVGVLGTILGFVLMLRAWWLFRQAETAICPTDKPSVLITRDVFAFSRNPMYLGMSLMLLGCAIYTGSLPFYLASLLFFLIMNFIYCPFEEERLVTVFGNQFEVYRQQVRRWF